MKIELIVKHLQEHMGMNPDAVGFDTMKKAVYSSMLANDLNDLDEYYNLIQDNPHVMQELIDTVVIPETSFFRDKKPFEALKNNLRHLRQSLCSEGETLKILSVPSSTGEEPYSIAMTCLEAGLSYGEFEIHACDISQRVLDVANRGQYGDYSFRGCHPIYQQRYFTLKDGLFQIDKQLMDSVDFFQGNLIDDQFINDLGDTFHIVFCRNLLIYFDRPTKHKAITTIDSILHDQGLLVVGHADTSILPSFGYKRFSDQFSFTYVKQHNQQNSVNSSSFFAEKGKTVMAALVAARTDIVASKSTITNCVESVALVPTSSKKINDISKEIETLLKNGSRSQAVKLCQKLIDEQGDASIAYHYLGCIAFSENDMEAAEEQFKRAIYLQPNDEKALRYLAKISKKRGNDDAALRYQKRADRIKARTVPQQES